jgi:hypothetical protein
VLVPSASGFGDCCGERRYNQGKNSCNRRAVRAVISFKGAKERFEQQMKPTMKRNLLAVVTAGAIALGGFIVTPAQADSRSGCTHGPAFGLREFTDKLDLTAEQQTRVQPILDQAKPQIAAIHQEAMQKMKTAIDSALSQIRPILTADQQKKFDAIQKAHQDIMNAQKALHEATQE